MTKSYTWSWCSYACANTGICVCSMQKPHTFFFWRFFTHRAVNSLKTWKHGCPDGPAGKVVSCQTWAQPHNLNGRKRRRTPKSWSLTSTYTKSNLKIPKSPWEQEIEEIFKWTEGGLGWEHEQSGCGGWKWRVLKRERGGIWGQVKTWYKGIYRNLQGRHQLQLLAKAVM